MPVDPRFNDGKDADALRTIGEVERALGIKQHVLRYWEQQFPMLNPLKRSGGRRYYRAEDIRIVETIDRLVNREGYTLKGARLALESVKTTNRADVAASPLRPKETRLQPRDILLQLRGIRDRLSDSLD